MTAGQTTGTFRLTGRIDPDNTVAELDEIDNNIAVRTTVTTTPEDPPVAAWAQVTMAIAATNAAAPGSGVRFVMSARNTGAADARAVEVILLYPQGLTFKSTANTNGFTCVNTPASGTGGGRVTCTRSYLESGQSASVEILMGMPATLGRYDTTATGRQRLGLLVNPSAHTIEVVHPDLSVTLTAPRGVRVGQEFAFRAVVRSHRASVDEIALQIAVPTPALSFRSLSASNGFTCVYIQGIVYCTGGAIGADADGVVEVRAVATREFMLRATVDPNNQIQETDESNNSAFRHVYLSP
jgi:uncharacterized repeat protein (TIGR01451 family)